VIDKYLVAISWLGHDRPTRYLERIERRGRPFTSAASYLSQAQHTLSQAPPVTALPVISSCPVGVPLRHARWLQWLKDASPDTFGKGNPAGVQRLTGH
jgi:hypothetical protein